MNHIARHVIDGELLAPGATVRVAGRLHPLAGRRVQRELPAGLSISEILAECGCGFAGGYVVYLGEHPIMPEHFRRIRVKPGAAVTFFPRLEDGGANSTIWRSVLSVVIAVGALIAAPYLAPYLVSGAAGLGLTLGTQTALGLAAGGVMLAGTLGLTALFPTRPAANNVATSTLNSIQGAQNQANPFGAVPVVLGRHRQSPYYAAKPFTLISGNDQYLRLLFCLGYGPLQIDSLQIGETPLSSLAVDGLEIRQGFAGDAPITLYPGEVDELALSIKLDAPTGVGPWSTSQFTAVDADDILLDVVAPNGINATDAQGSPISWSVTVNTQYRLVGAGGWTAGPDLFFPTSYGPARRGVVIPVSRGQYEVQLRKATPDGFPQFTRDEVDWTSLKSFKSGKAITFPKPLALVALSIKATDQLSGVISTFNCITTSLVNAYSGSGSTWNANTASQNPADLFRHVLQGPANARPVPDAQINITNLQGWWAYCSANGFKFNQVVQQTGSVYDKLCDIASAGRAVPTFIDGQWGVVWDRPSDPIVQHFTPRNSWGLQGQRAYAQLPHGWRVSFINEQNGFTQDERIVYDDGYSALNATLFEGIQFPGVTDPSLVWRHGRFHIAQARLRPETITLNVGWEQLVCTRGDRVRVTHDVMLIGLASGRIKTVVGQVVTFDETVIVASGKTYGFSFRVPDDARVLTCAVDGATTAGEYNSLTLVGDLSLVTPGTLFAFGETNQESADYRVQAIAHQRDLVATLTLVDDAPAISSADSGAIPAYNPNVTIPPDPFTLPPRDLQYSEVIDGSGQGVRALVMLAWQVPRFGRIASFQVQSRDDNAGGGLWQTVDSVLPPHAESAVVLPSPGVWSYRVRCIFTDGTASDWVQLVNLVLKGLLRAPSPVTNVRNAYISGRSFLSWDQSVDPRVVLVEIRKGASFGAAQIVADAATSPWQTVGDDTYYITTYINSPFGDRVYATPATIALSGTVAVENIVVNRDERATGWTGTFTGGVGIDQSNNFLRTAGGDDFLNRSNFLGTGNFIDGDGTVQVGGIYWSALTVDVGAVSFCRVSNDWTATGVPEADDFLGNADFLSNLDFLKASLSQYVRVRPVIRVSQTGPVPSWGATQVWSPDVYKGRIFQLGIQFEILDTTQNAIAYLLSWAWSIDVPDRLDSYQDLTVPVGGTVITFQPTGASAPQPFNGGLNDEPLPHITPSIQSPNAGDLVVWSLLSLSSVKIQVKNAGVDVGGSHVNVLVRGY